MTTLVALDIGGANIKLVASCGVRIEHPFPLWKKPEALAETLRGLLKSFPPAATILSVMTGELADCFESRESGVRLIASALEIAACGRDVWWFGLDGEWHRHEVLEHDPARFAASNWLALATFTGGCGSGGDAILLDVGSTTTDIVPILGGLPAPHGVTDTERLMCGELLYLGIQRTPLCAVVRQVPYRGVQVPIAAEWFATTLDAFVTLGIIAESAESAHTADGRESTREAARRRLARTILAIGADEFESDDATALAQFVAGRIESRIAEALMRVSRERRIPLERVVLAGSGHAIGMRALRRLGVASWRSVDELFGEPSGNASTAMALVRLWDAGVGRARRRA